MAGQDAESIVELLQRLRPAHTDLKVRLAADNDVDELFAIARRASQLTSQLASRLQAAETAKAAPAQESAPKPTVEKPKPTLPPPPPVPTSAPLPPPPAIPADATELVVGNLPLGWGSDRVKLFLGKHKVTAVSITKEPNTAEAVVKFATPAELQAAVRIVPRQSVLNQRLSAGVRRSDGATTMLAEGGSVGGARGEKRKAGRDEPPAKKQRGKQGQAEPAARTDIRDAVCPWWSIPYGQQLQDKAAELGEQLCRVTREVMRQSDRGMHPAWAMEAAMGRQRGGRCAPLLGILRSPQIEGYRNKSEFTCGRDAEGLLAVGFQLGRFTEGYITVAQGHGCRHISTTALAYADMLQHFLRTQSKQPVWDKTTSTGFWRLLTVREGRKAAFLPAPGCQNLADAVAPPFAELDPLKWLVDTPGDRQDGFPVGMAVDQVTEAEPTPGPPEDVLVMVQINPNGTNPETESEAELRALEALIREEEKKQGRPRATLLVQIHSGVSNAAPANAPLVPFPPEAGSAGAASASDASLQDTLCDLTFRISPMAFFQVNSPTACILYRLAGQWVGAGSDTLLLDVCCGTGTIGLTLARGVAKVVGIDIVESAIQDARANAQLNGITNCDFRAGKAEDVLPEVLRSEAGNYKHVVAILDPPRSGLHKSVVKNLLKCEQIKRLVYVSCNPSSLADNLITFCSPPRYGEKYTPFRPVRAVAVDLFPHTRHVEGVVLLQRD